MLAFIGYKFIEFLAFVIPYPIAYFIARILARLAVAARINLTPLKKNISRVLALKQDDPRVYKTAIMIYKNWLMNVVDFLKHKRVSRDKLKQLIELEGMENLKNALKKGKGAIIFTAHIGNFEWGACRIAVEIENTWGMGMRRKYEPLNRFFESKRISKRLHTIYNNRLLNIFRILEQNGVVAIPTDWDPTDKADPVDFFGKKSKIPYGPIVTALKSGAPLLPSFIYRKEKYTHHQVIGPPLAIDSSKDASHNLDRMVEVLEAYIRKHIDQWEMFHDIWVD
ncbi:MAG: lysophospholipid acyltransferase family protein [Actinomycetota bacterium]|jgi:KDO2-lipid IV(A) lauroyltransferase|nr:lysophospholipid acyltransferase family protein [Actinomycetota bacterium]